MGSEDTAKTEGKKARKKELNASEEVSGKESHGKKRTVEGSHDTGDTRNVGNKVDGIGIKRHEGKAILGKETEVGQDLKASKTAESEERKKKRKKKKNADVGAADQDEELMNDQEYLVRDSRKDHGDDFQDHHYCSVVKGNVDGKKEEKKKKKKKKKKENSDSREEELMTDVREQHTTIDSAEKLESEKKRKKRKEKRNDAAAAENEGIDTDDGKHSLRHRESMSTDDLDGKVVEKDGSEKERKKQKKRKRCETNASTGNEVLGNEGHIDADGVLKKRKDKGNKKKNAKGNNINEGGSAVTKGGEACEPSGNSPSARSAKKVKFSDHVEVFPPDMPSTVAQNGLVQGKRFSAEEDEMVKDAVLSYVEMHNLGEEGLGMVLNNRRHRKLRNCWKEIGEALPWRPYMAVYYRAHVLFERGEKRKWTQEEYEMVRKSHEEKGACWKSLAVELGKHRFHVKDTWRRINVANKKSGHWSHDEYQKFFDLVNEDLRMKAYAERKSKHGMLRDNISWGVISEQLSTRSNATCCRKWYQCLTSSLVAEGCWADTDDYRLLIALYELDKNCEEDVNWDNLLEHRSGDLCRKRWRQMIRHIGDDKKRSFAEQVEVLSGRYCPDILEAREAYDSRTPVDV